MTPIRLTSILAAAIVVVGCGNTESQSGLDIAAASVAGVVGGAEPVADARSVLTSDLIAASPGSLLLVVQEDGDNGFVVAPVSSNRGTLQWQTLDGTALLQRNGVLVGTRGFGFDLMTADIEPLAAALVQGGGRDLRRVNRVLVAGRMVALEYFCTVTPRGVETLASFGRTFRTTRYDESCAGADGDSFTNSYWLSANGAVRRSRERVSPQIGMFDIFRLTE
ncbi:YjbF family lipoprotein [Jannaschia donghaensis]|uniref:Group 4 capsule protein B homolog n=1 Tax=Jannaschia donghaensis TaxID=420998 RepID=A0A0M6YGE3_9RHOB|nr:YjbF family lipoprotein [Jannaschia donghaensis]CTQ49421.1 hypothetical protein JDO7802_01435 [Jannaschia donghaensis]